MMSKKTETLTWLMITVVVVLSAFQLIPWYSQEQPIHVEDKVYYPGDNVDLIINRTALIDLEGRVTRELICRQKNGIEYEVVKASHFIALERGKKTIIVPYLLPDSPGVCYKNNSYVWTGVITYRPLGLIERTWKWETEPFQVRLKGDTSEAVRAPSS